MQYLAYELEDIPAQSTLLLASKDEAISFPRSNMSLLVCEQCGFGSNQAFEIEKVHYTSDYQDSQINSATFRSYAQQLMQRWDEHYGLRGKRVLEIGCGPGDFLKLLSEHYECHCTGYDPALPGVSRSANIVLEPAAFDPANIESTDYILCRHTLEHVADVRKLVSQAYAACRKNPGSIVIFEVPDFERVLVESAFWDVYHEHCAYFTPEALRSLFVDVGFQVLAQECLYQGQYLVIEATIGEVGGESLTAPSGVAESSGASKYAALSRSFADSCQGKIRYWRDWNLALESEKQRLALWGSGSKAVSFVSALGSESALACVVDINPARQGAYMPGVSAPIVGPQDLASYRPDRIVVMNPVYLPEITTQVSELGIDCQIQHCEIDIQGD